MHICVVVGDARVHLGRDALLFLVFAKTKETHVGALEDLDFGGVPPGVLDFTNMGALQHELAETTLADTSANGLGKSTVEQHAVPDIFLAFGASTEVKLGGEDLRVDTDTHGGELKRHLEEGVPDKQVTVQSVSAVGALGQPVIVVGSTTVVTQFTIGLLATNSHKEDSSVFLAENVFTLLGGGIRVLLDHVIRVGKDNLPRQARLDVVFGADELVGVVDSLVDVLDRALERVDIAVGRVDDLFPVPLIHVPAGRKKKIRSDNWSATSNVEQGQTNARHPWCGQK